MEEARDGVFPHLFRGFLVQDVSVAALDLEERSRNRSESVGVRSKEALDLEVVRPFLEVLAEKDWIPGIHRRGGAMNTNVTYIKRSIVSLELPKSAPTLVVKTRAIVDAMSDSPLFPDPDPPLSTVTAALAAFEAAHTAVQARELGAVAARFVHVAVQPRRRRDVGRYARDPSVEDDPRRAGARDEGDVSKQGRDEGGGGRLESGAVDRRAVKPRTNGKTKSASSSTVDSGWG